MPRISVMQRVRGVRSRQDCGAIAILVVILLAGGVCLPLFARCQVQVCDIGRDDPAAIFIALPEWGFS